MSRTLFSLAGFQVITDGRFWVIAEEGAKVWRKIARAVDAAYAIDYLGIECAPKPRVHFLHRNLFALLESATSGELKVVHLRREGIQEFLDDLCPCGKKHTTEAIRKLVKRLSRTQRSK